MAEWTKKVMAFVDLPERLSTAYLPFIEEQLVTMGAILMIEHTINHSTGADAEGAVPVAMSLSGLPPGDHDLFRKVGPTELSVRLGEMTTCRMVDNFLAFLSDLAASLLIARPEQLRTRAKIEVEEVLRHDTMREFIEARVEAEIERLAYKGYTGLAAHFEKMGLPLTGEERDSGLLHELIETRNILVHNRGFVSKTFKKRLPGHPANIGDRVYLPSDSLLRQHQFLDRLARSMDARAFDKFGLEEAEVPSMFEQMTGQPEATAET